MASKKSSPYITIFVAVILMIIAAFFYYSQQPTFVHYKDFDIDIPVNYKIHGIDVSRYQSNINWADVKDMKVKNIKIGFCFIKATEGIYDVDRKFKKNWSAATNAGVVKGAYHYFNPNRTGKQQALNFIDAVDLQKGDLPPVLDIEDIGNLSKELLQQKINDWITTVQNEYKVKPIIYTGADFYTRYLAGKFDDFPLWVAHYLVKDKPRVSRQWSFWQHSESGHVNGIDAYVDFNVFSGDSADFKKLLIQ